MGRPRLTVLKPRLTTLYTNRVPVMQAGGWRTSNMTTAERGYGYRWQKARERHLRAHPLCARCEAENPPRITAATIVDHRIPHRGDMVLFWDETNWDSLCASHHSSDKQREENGKPARRRIGANGWPD